MKSPIVSLKTAKLAKEAGFNLSTKDYYGCDDPSGTTVKPNQHFHIKLQETGVFRDQSGTEIYNAPELWMMQEWLRENHEVEISAFRTIETVEGDTYGCELEIWRDGTCYDLANIYGKSYNEVMDRAFQVSLKYIIAEKD